MNPVLMALKSQTVDTSYDRESERFKQSTNMVKLTLPVQR